VGINSPRNGGNINNTNTQAFGTCSTAKILIIGKVGYILIIGNGKVTVSSRNGIQAKEFTSQSFSINDRTSIIGHEVTCYNLVFRVTQNSLLVRSNFFYI
jgi:hypothetical protein